MIRSAEVHCNRRIFNFKLSRCKQWIVLSDSSQCVYHLKILTNPVLVTIWFEWWERNTFYLTVDSRNDWNRVVRSTRFYCLSTTNNRDKNTNEEPPLLLSMIVVKPQQSHRHTQMRSFSEPKLLSQVRSTVIITDTRWKQGKRRQQNVLNISNHLKIISGKWWPYTMNERLKVNSFRSSRPLCFNRFREYLLQNARCHQQNDLNTWSPECHPKNRMPFEVQADCHNKKKSNLKKWLYWRAIEINQLIFMATWNETNAVRSKCDWILLELLNTEWEIKSRPQAEP